MSAYCTVWLSFGLLLSSLLLAAGATECSDKQTLLKPLPSTLPQLTDCLLACTEMTYMRKLQLQDKRNIRMQVSTEGNHGEYCWSTEIKCNIGESFQHGYVVLPVDVSAVTAAQLQVRWAASPLQAHAAPVTVPDDCGLRYDVTEHFGPARTVASFCVEVIGQQDELGDTVLQCPPFLVTFWERSPTRFNP